MNNGIGEEGLNKAKDLIVRPAMPGANARQRQHLQKFIERRRGKDELKAAVLVGDYRAIGSGLMWAERCLDENVCVQDGGNHVD